MKKPDLFKTFDEYYRATKSNLVSPNPDFHIFRYEDISPDVVPKMSAFRMTFYQFCVCKESNSSINITDSHLISKNKQLISFAPGHLIQWEKLGDWKGYLLFIKESFVGINSTNSNAQMMFGFLRPDSNPVTNLNDDDFKLLSDLCERMLYEYHQYSADKMLILSNYL